MDVSASSTVGYSGQNGMPWGIRLRRIILVVAGTDMTEDSKKVVVTLPCSTGDGTRVIPSEVMKKAIKEVKLPVPIHMDHRKMGEITKLEGEPGELKAEIDISLEDASEFREILKGRHVGMTMSSVIDRKGRMMVKGFNYIHVPKLKPGQ